jgi:hypothetical protein
VGGSQRLSYNVGLSAMFQFHCEPNSNQNLTNGMSSDGNEVPRLHYSTDTALDVALRNLPLPAGLLTRLDQSLYAMLDESADQIDWLSC